MRKLRVFMLMVLAVAGFAVLAADVVPAPAFADTATQSVNSVGKRDLGGCDSGRLEWECKLEVILKSLQGKVAKAVALMGIVVAGWGLVWGGEIGEFARRLFMLTLVLSIIMLSSQFVAKLKTGFTSSATTTSATK